MSMPKGFKKEHGYATVDSLDGSMGYREIAEFMTENGDKMNHSTARNVFLSAMSKLAGDVCTQFDGHSRKKEEMAKDPRFQSGIYDILVDIG
jgi:hypothetical protein